MTHLTLKQALALLVADHGFSEVLDRLTELADSNAQAEEDPDTGQAWSQIAANLEKTTQQAANLAECHTHHIEGSLGHD